MNFKEKVLFLCLIGITILLFTTALVDSEKISNEAKEIEEAELELQKQIIDDKIRNINLTKGKKHVVYLDYSLSELGEKLERNMGSDLDGAGAYFARKSIELGVDPFLALAISLHETGCNHGNCSQLVKACYNIGGQKGSPRCGSGSYKRYNNLKEGIDGFLSNLKKNYLDQGLRTPEAINKKYAENPLWHQQINKYIQLITSR